MGQKLHRSTHAKRAASSAVLKIAILIVALLAVAAIVLVAISLLSNTTEEDDPGSTVTTTSASTTTTTTTTTHPPIATGTTAANTTFSVTVGSSGLLEYDTTGHYVQPDGGDWNLLLVNDWNGMEGDYEKSVTFVPVGNNQTVDSRINADLQALMTAGAQHGIGVQSGYRSAAHQGTLYWRQVNIQKNAGKNDVDAQTAAGKVVKRPGYSEHNTGLAVDLGGSGNFQLDQSFEDTAAFQWLIENCADYGFILRFPKGKEAITGVIYEPWHYRYVGKEAAQYIMANGLCLEEYLAEQKK